MADRGNRGGKRALVSGASGYYDNNTAGTRREIGAQEWGIKREFEGSDTREYTFSDRIHGTHTITAKSYWDAVRIAESMGYKASDYKKRGGRRGRR